MTIFAMHLIYLLLRIDTNKNAKVSKLHLAVTSSRTISQTRIFSNGCLSTSSSHFPTRLSTLSFQSMEDPAIPALLITRCIANDTLWLEPLQLYVSEISAAPKVVRGSPDLAIFSPGNPDLVDSSYTYHLACVWLRSWLNNFASSKGPGKRFRLTLFFLSTILSNGGPGRLCRLANRLLALSSNLLGKVYAVPRWSSSYHKNGFRLQRYSNIDPDLGSMSGPCGRNSRHRAGHPSHQQRNRR